MLFFLSYSLIIPVVVAALDQQTTNHLSSQIQHSLRQIQTTTTTTTSDDDDITYPDLFISKITSIAYPWFSIKQVSGPEICGLSPTDNSTTYSSNMGTSVNVRFQKKDSINNYYSLSIIENNWSFLCTNNDGKAFFYAIPTDPDDTDVPSSPSLNCLFYLNVVDQSSKTFQIRNSYNKLPLQVHVNSYYSSTDNNVYCLGDINKIGYSLSTTNTNSVFKIKTIPI
jgi:hypothetical protein